MALGPSFFLLHFGGSSRGGGCFFSTTQEAIQWDKLVHVKSSSFLPVWKANPKKHQHKYPGNPGSNDCECKPKEISNTHFQVFLTSKGIPISGNQSFHGDVLQIVNLKPLLYWYPTITHLPKKSEFPYHPLFFRALCGAKEVVRAPASPRIRFLLSNAGANRTCIHDVQRIAEMSQHHSC